MCAREQGLPAIPDVLRSSRRWPPLSFATEASQAGGGATSSPRPRRLGPRSPDTRVGVGTELTTLGRFQAFFSTTLGDTSSRHQAVPIVTHKRTPETHRAESQTDAQARPHAHSETCGDTDTRARTRARTPGPSSPGVRALSRPSPPARFSFLLLLLALSLPSPFTYRGRFPDAASQSLA